MLRSLCSLLAAAVVLATTNVSAQTTNPPAAGKQGAATGKDTATSEKKKSAHPFHGKLAALDKRAKTITVGKSVYPVAPDAKIKKDGQPAKLDDGVVGEPVSGYVKPGPDGKLVATSVTFGTPPASKSATKDKSQK